VRLRERRDRPGVQELLLLCIREVATPFLTDRGVEAAELLELVVPQEAVVGALGLGYQ
jgi:hypothetical protein